jgi:hypothetical protein
LETAVMLQIGSWLLPELSLIIATAAATHLVVSFSQTLMHAKLGHHAMGGKFFRNHINFHHTNYSKDHLVSATSYGQKIETAGNTGGARSRVSSPRVVRYDV